MPFYSQTLDDIPKEFLPRQKGRNGKSPESDSSPKTEDLLFILTVLLFLQDEPFFSESL